MTAGPATEPQAIRVEPLSPAVGLWIGGVDLLRLDAGGAAMIEDLWQLGGALLFREHLPAEDAALKLAAVLAKGPVGGGAPADATADRAPVAGDWSMPGAQAALPPKALVFAADEALPGLLLAGMEAAADAMHMEDPDFLAQIAGARAPHGEGGPPHPVLHRHPQTGEACFYPPPPQLASFPGAAALGEYAAQERFCYAHEWRPGDVLAIDPRAVRCRWASGRDEAVPAITLPGAAPLLETRGSFGDWD